MKLEKIEERVELPDGVSASYDTATHTLLVKGEKGELSRVFFNPKITITAGKEVTFLSKNATLREKKQLYTMKAHTKNMVKGVKEGFTYKLKICSGHFPMNVGLKNDQFEIKNFIGEKVPRTLTIKQGAEVKVDGSDITVTGPNKEIVGQVAADIEQLSRRTGFDNRIFQDGIFIVEKDGKAL